MTEQAREGVAIPGVLRKFLERASLAYAGTRDLSLVAHFHWVCGWRAEPEADRLAFFVAEPFAARLLQDVAQCPRVAVTIEHIGPHETYQFKGDFAGRREVGEAERAAFAGCRERFVLAVQEIEKRFHFPAEVLERYLGTPALVAVMQVHEIFVQTPGPGAGRRLAPPEAK